jgi:hypothetical protein
MPIPAGLTAQEQDIILARYRENADQARHHETLRERSTNMVAQTSGVLLGLLGFKQGSPVSSTILYLIGSLIVLLGLWGVYSAVAFDNRARRHRERIDKLLVRLGEITSPSAQKHRLNLVWVAFHLGIIAIGAIIIFYPWPQHVQGPESSNSSETRSIN